MDEDEAYDPVAVFPAHNVVPRLDVAQADPTSRWPVEVGLTDFNEELPVDADLERHTVRLSREDARRLIEALEYALKEG